MRKAFLTVSQIKKDFKILSLAAGMQTFVWTTSRTETMILLEVKSYQLISLKVYRTNQVVEIYKHHQPNMIIKNAVVQNHFANCNRQQGAMQIRIEMRMSNHPFK